MEQIVELLGKYGWQVDRLEGFIYKYLDNGKQISYEVDFYNSESFRIDLQVLIEELRERGNRENTIKEFELILAGI